MNESSNPTRTSAGYSKTTNMPTYTPKGGPSATRILDIGFCPGWFHGLCTLSPEYFSTFPRGTCKLSVLWTYLALGGVYHLLSAVCSNNATLRENDLAFARNTRPNGACTLHGTVSWAIHPERCSTQHARTFQNAIRQHLRAYEAVSDHSLNATFRRRLGSLGDYALGCSRFARRY